MSDIFNRQSVIELAVRSPLAVYNWHRRGKAPIGYIKGIALVYARALQRLHENDPIAIEMTKDLGPPSRDALAFYGLHGGTREGTLRILFALLIGLGMRESSGSFCEGRDVSARNISADTAEAGVFQMSWNITAAVPMIKALYTRYLEMPLDDGFASIFHEGVHCTQQQLKNYGTGPGADYQFQAKARPAFAAEAAAIGLRNLRTHWGPINRQEAEVRPEAIGLLKQIEALVDAVHPSASSGAFT